jgi:hypothetical protein
VELLLVAGADEGAEKEEESVKWLVETALRCNALDVITSSSRTRTAFVSLLRPCTFPHNRKDSADSAHSTSERGGVEALVAAGGYVVKGDDDEAPPLVVLRRDKDLLPLAVVQLIEAGDVLGAGMLVLRATQTHPALCTPSAAVVALRAYLVRIQNGASAERQDEGGRGGAVSLAVQLRCNAAFQSFEKMLASSEAR